MVAILQQAFQARRAVKIIAGLNNFDSARVVQIVRAAEAGGATFVDIACDAELIRLVRRSTDLPVCVSAIEPQGLLMAVRSGADCVEIGNFDSFYARGVRFDAEVVLDLARRSRDLLGCDVMLSVTVPHTLSLDVQVSLAVQLEALGADIIQTEGGTSSRPIHPGTLGLVEKAAPTLAAAYEISRSVSVPVLCASGLSAVTVPMALACGAAGVGVGSAVNRLGDEVAMVAQVRAIVEAVEQACVFERVSP
ncbi:MAG: DUF561 domain-containing protein [Aphanocapsa lilacina HA4352-LM1]|jgi:hypothetical protein|nr:DUF561 domain-containing protein [Aphanocapsa lilacina HA4352-LM1]